MLLCPDRNLGALVSSTKNLMNYFGEHPKVAVLGAGATAGEVSECNRYCRTIIGGATHTSLINAGVRNSPCEWVFVYMGGSPMTHRKMYRYLKWADDEKTVFYPVIQKRWRFHEASINGLFFHRSVFGAAGPLDEQSDSLEQVKLLWQAKAEEAGYRFAGIVGVA